MSLREGGVGEMRTPAPPRCQRSLPVSKSFGGMHGSNRLGGNSGCPICWRLAGGPAWAQRITYGH